MLPSQVPHAGKHIDAHLQRHVYDVDGHPVFDDHPVFKAVEIHHSHLNFATCRGHAAPFACVRGGY